MPPTSQAVLLDPDRSNVTLGGPAAANRQFGPQLYQNISTGLAAFAVLVILRFVVTRIHRWWVGAPGLQKDQLSRYASAASHRSSAFLVNQQRLHHRFLQGHERIMDDKSRGVSRSSSAADTSNPDARRAQHVSFTDGDDPEKSTAMVGQWEAATAGDDSVVYGSGIAGELAKARHLRARPPPPPLTPPELSTAVFTFEDRRRSYAASAHELDTGFFDQPNPDYTSSTSTAVASHDATDATSPSLARRRSYTKTLPISVPPTASSSADSDAADLVFSPSSYPPTSPLLPPPPPGHHGLALDGSPHHEIEMQGEILSVMDDHGSGWKRHTRVYGGGVCLACAASGREGGFYGDNVRPEEKR